MREKTHSESDGEELKKCFLCGATSEKKCEYCNLIYFCNENHFKLHRPEELCFPFKISHRKDVGRIMVATRDIEPLELILYDTTKAFGPKNGGLVCIECLKADPKGQCMSCGWPICNNDSMCQGKHTSHSTRECEVLQSNPNKEIFINPSWSLDYVCAIATLRLLLLRDDDPVEYERFQYLMDHNEERKQDEGIWNGYKKFITDFLRIDCNLSETFTEDEVERASGIYWTNAFACSQGGGQAVFPTFSFVSHSCTSNCDHTVFPKRHLVLQAKHFITKGTELNINYVSPVQGRIKRRKKLKLKWYFECTCNRCIDATEFGSHLSSHLCETCGEILLPENASMDDSNYICSSGHTKSSDDIIALENQVTMEMKEVEKKDFNGFQSLLEKYSSKLHATHYLLLLLKRHMITIWDDSLTEDNLTQKIELCEEVLNGCSKVDSGYNRDRGMMLHYLSDAQKKLNRLLLSSGKISEEEFNSRVNVCMKNFNESTECLMMKIKKT